MPDNPHLLQRLTAIQQALMAQHFGGKGLPNATAGSERETFLRGFLQQLFPAHRRFATGAITDSTGAISGQVDIAIEYGYVPSFPMPSTPERLLLAESVRSGYRGQVRSHCAVGAIRRHNSSVLRRCSVILTP